MSRVFLISSNTATDPYPVYPLGMAVVSGALHAAGHQVCQYDSLVAGMEPLRAAIEDFAPDLISISLRNIDNVDSFTGEEGWYLHKTRNLVETLRTLSSVPIVVGGPALTIMPEAIAAYLGVDHVIIGEGEHALPELVRLLAAGEDAPQVIQRQRPLSGEQFGSPLFDQTLVNFYLRKSGMVNLQTKRGCPFRCSYCSYPHLEGDQFRVRPPELVVDELQRLKREHGIERVFFTDSIFNDPRGHYLELVDEFLRRDLRLHWSGFFRPQGLNSHNLALMKRAGLYALELGTDAAADQTLTGINKGLRFDEVLAVNQACIDQRLPAAHFIMFGGPDEDERSLEEGLDNIDKLGISVVFAFSGIRIFPESPLHGRAIAEGLVTAETSLLKPAYYFSPRLDRKQMEARIMERFAGKANRVFPPSEGLKRLEVMKKFGYNGLLWDRLVRFPR